MTQATQTETSGLNQSVQTRSQGSPPTASRPHLQVCYPSYALPDLSFLKTAGTPPGATVHLAPRGPPPTRVPGRASSRPRPFSLDDVERLKKDKGLAHVRDWDSLNVLLPAECRQILEASSSSSGYHSPATPRNFKPKVPDNLFENNRYPTTKNVIIFSGNQGWAEQQPMLGPADKRRGAPAKGPSFRSAAPNCVLCAAKLTLPPTQRRHFRPHDPPPSPQSAPQPRPDPDIR